MATTTTPPAVSKGSPPARITKSSRAWPVGFFLLAVFVFALYQWVLPHAGAGVQQTFQDWLPMSAVNEAVLWLVFALGLNIVVGYSGLLDLGYVAFWAIGGYCAGWFMSPFAFQMSPGWKNLKINLFGNATGSGARHPSELLAGPAARRADLCLLRRADRRADPSAEERLPGAGDPGLRRDHPPDLLQR